MPTWRKKLQYKSFRVFHLRQNNNFLFQIAEKKSFLLQLLLPQETMAKNNAAYFLKCILQGLSCKSINAIEIVLNVIVLHYY